MCGIAGIVAPETPDRASTIRNMCAAMVHRGPDSQGLFENAHVALGMRRLSIIDVAHGDQPVFNESGTVAAVFNGEIYNFRELRDQLISKGHVLRSRSDSEIIPHLYEEYGENLVRHLRGMFAIGLWDAERSRLLLARDRLGKKPLYYRTDPAGIAFASELKGLLADRATDRRVDEIAISHYLTLQYVPAPFSALRSVRKVEPAHVVISENGKVRTSRYWSMNYLAESTFDRRSEEDLADELRERILDCVKIRLVSERPVGAFLSGGLDSSAIVAAMSRVSAGQVRTFSIGFDEESHNELPYARQVAEAYGTDHHEMVVRPDVIDMLPKLAQAFDEPFADSSAIPSYYLAAMTREHVVVALNGDGGDEALGGYLRYSRYLQASPRKLPSSMARGLGRVGAALRPYGPRSQFIRRAATAAVLLADGDPARRYARFLSYFRPEEKADLLCEDFAQRVRAHDTYALIDTVWQAHLATDPVNRLLAVDSYTYLPGDLLPKVDITTMAVSLEARSPLLDHTLLEWTSQLSGTMKVRGMTTKYLLKKALDPWLPAELIHRKKMGFGVPLGSWLRGPLKGVVYDLLTDGTARGRGWFEPVTVDRLISEHMAGQDRSPHLYALLMLEMWHREVLDVPAPAPQ